MKKADFPTFIGLFLMMLLLFSGLDAEINELKAEDLIGKETLNFYLASYDDRLVHYGDEYYSKYTLILTFFPAAFTPV